MTEMRTLSKDEVRKIWDAVVRPMEDEQARHDHIEGHVARFGSRISDTEEFVKMMAECGLVSALTALLEVIADDPPGCWIEQLIEQSIAPTAEELRRLDGDDMHPADVAERWEQIERMQAILDAWRARKAMASIARRSRKL